MQYLATLLSALALVPAVLSAPDALSAFDVNPYLGTSPFANKGYAAKLEETIKYFKKQKDTLNAARTRTVQRTPTFSWVSQSADVSVFASVHFIEASL